MFQLSLFSFRGCAIIKAGPPAQNVAVVPPLLLTATVIRPIACNIFSCSLTLIDVLQFLKPQNNTTSERSAPSAKIRYETIKVSWLKRWW